MFGSYYWKRPEILFAQRKDLGFKGKFPGFLRPFICLYVLLFGVPEIGFQIRVSSFIRAVKNLRFNRVLDAGCGLGLYSQYLEAVNQQAKIDAFDSDQNAVKICKSMYLKKEHPRLNFFKENLVNFAKNKKYDLVISIDVLEHVFHWKKALSSLTKSLCSGGYLLLHIPLLGQRRHLRYFSTWEHETHKDQGINEGEIKSWLKDNDYFILKWEGDHRLFGSLAWELNMLAMKSLVLGALFYPLFYFLMKLDFVLPVKSKKYNCLLILAQKT